MSDQPSPMSASSTPSQATNADEGAALGASEGADVLVEGAREGANELVEGAGEGYGAMD